MDVELHTMTAEAWNLTNRTGPNYTLDYDIYGADFGYLQYLWTYVPSTIFGVIIITGLAGNTLVLYVILSKPAMRTVTNLLLLNLACADISFLLIGAPMTAYKYQASTWGLGNVGCKVFRYFTYVPACVTVYTLVAISAQRYTIIVCQQSSILKAHRNVVILTLLIWASMLGINAPVLSIHNVIAVGDYEYCGIIDNAITPLLLCFFVLAYALPLTIICVFYISIICHLRHKRRVSVATNNKDRTAHVARVVFTVVLVFGVSWLPVHVNGLMYLVTSTSYGQWYVVWCILSDCMAYGNSCANPFIYTFVSVEFRKAFREVVCCTKRSAAQRR